MTVDLHVHHIEIKIMIICDYVPSFTPVKGYSVELMQKLWFLLTFVVKSENKILSLLPSLTHSHSLFINHLT